MASSPVPYVRTSRSFLCNCTQPLVPSSWAVAVVRSEVERLVRTTTGKRFAALR